MTRHTTLGALGASALTLLAAVALVPEARAGACGAVASVALELVPPGAPIPLDGESGPLIRQVAGERSGSGRMARPRNLFAPLTVRGPSGAVEIAERSIAPGIHRLSGAFVAGRHRVAGIAGGGSVTFARGPGRPLPAPVLASATHRTQHGTGGIASAIGRGGPTTSASIAVALAEPAPAEAWMLLLYPNPGASPGRAIHAVEIGSGARSASFHQGHSVRCGPNLPLAGVPAAGAPVALAWLTRNGRLSPLSNALPADAAAP